MQKILCIIIATVLWGLWAIFNKLAVDRSNPMTVQLISTIAFALLLPFAFAFLPKSNLVISTSGIFWTLSAVLSTAFAALAYMLAVQKSTVTDIIGYTSINPLITFIVAWAFLGEAISIMRMIGICCIVIGSIFLSR